MKYPKTLYYTYSPSVGRDDKHVEGLFKFINHDIVITEKIDGTNTRLYKGNVYDRSKSSEPAKGAWFSMVKRFHAQKTRNHDFMIYGEDIYGIHSIKYMPVKPQNTFMAFALYNPSTKMFLEWETFEEMMRARDIPTVPILFKGIFESVADLNNFIRDAHQLPSSIGGIREGIVIRVARSFGLREFEAAVCKSVRREHVQSDAEHWTKNWEHCELVR